MVIHKMRERRAAYNVISNNCQNFCVELLDAIQIGAHREFATSFAIYQRATGHGTIKDLFLDSHPEEQEHQQEIDPERPLPLRTNTVTNAQQVMEGTFPFFSEHEVPHSVYFESLPQILVNSTFGISTLSIHSPISGHVSPKWRTNFDPPQIILRSWTIITL